MSEGADTKTAYLQPRRGKQNKHKGARQNGGLNDQFRTRQLVRDIIRLCQNPLSDLRRWSDYHAPQSSRGQLFSARQGQEFGLRQVRGIGGSERGFQTVARLITTDWRKSPPVIYRHAGKAAFSPGGTSSRSLKAISLQSAGLMEAYRGSQSRQPVLIQQSQTAAEDNGAQSSDSGGGGGAGGGGDDFVAAALQANVGAAEDALKRAQASGIGVNAARAALATAKRLLAEHGFGAAANQVCSKKRSKTGGKSRRPKAMPRARGRRDKGK